MSAKEARADQSMKPEMFKAGTLITCTDQGNTSGIWDVIFIIMLGLTPLILLAVIGFAVVVLIMLIRFLVDPVRFFLVQQLSFAIVMIAGMAIAVSAYILTIRHALRQIGRWRQSGQTTKVLAGLVVFTLVALIVLALPVLVVLVFY